MICLLILKDAIMLNDMEIAKKTINDRLSTIHIDTLQTVRDNTFEVLVWKQTIKGKTSEINRKIRR